MAAATALLVFPSQGLAGSESEGNVTIVTPESEEFERFGSPASIEQDRSDFKDAPSSPHWKSPTRSFPDISSGDSEVDLSSLDSLQLTDSPDVTTISTSSHRSSLSSLSGVVRKSRGMSLQWSKSPKQQQDSSGSPTLKNLGWHRKSEYHELKDQLNKFSVRQGPAKANYLRLSLLSFLRRPRSYLMPNAFEQDYPIKVLAAWYNQLLNDLTLNQRQVNASDRSAFYEALSGLMTRPEWMGHQHKPLYQSLLRRTIQHILTRNSMPPHLPVAQAAYMGKVLAYGYFYIPGVAAYLLKKLNISRESVSSIMTLEAKPTNFSGNLVGVPAHLQELVNATSLPFNIVVPDWLGSVPEQSWTRHWHPESILFASFLKHICTLQTQLFPIMNPLGLGSAEEEDALTSDSLVLSAPGMILILAAVVDNLNAVVRQYNRVLGTRNGNPYARRPPPVSASPTSRTRIDQIKCFSTFREVLHCDEATVIYFTSFSKAFDRVIRATAVKTEVYDMDSCVTVCDLAEEWLSSLFLVPSAKSEQHILANHYRVVDWRFWITVAQRMLTSNNCHTEIRALSFLFNIWSNLPGYCRGQPNDISYLRYVTDWLLSSDVFLQLFCHWSPLVRSYYHRILCFRIASVGLDAESWFLDVEMAEYYAESRALLSKRLKSMVLWCTDLKSVTDLTPTASPSLPVPRLRIAIRPNAAQQATVHRIESSLNRLYPFDIFDNAAYWLPEPQHPAQTGLKRQSSVSSDASIRTTATGTSARSLVTISSEDSESSFTSTDSNMSNMSNMSNISVDTQSSRSSRLSLTNLASILGMASGSSKATLEGSEMKRSESNSNNTTTSADDEPENGTAADDKERSEGSTVNSDTGMNSSLKRRWTFLKGLLPGKSSIKEKPADPEAPEPPVSDDPVGDQSDKDLQFRTRSRGGSVHKNRVSKQERHSEKLERKRTLRMNRKREQHEAAQAAVPLPYQLAEQRPEIQRSPTRFVLVPGNAPVSPIAGKVPVPRLPFSAPITMEQEDEPSQFRSKATGLSVWNYGFRSLAEWNIIVNMFESFATQEHERTDGNIEMLQMPFLVAEIPWRAVG